MYGACGPVSSWLILAKLARSELDRPGIFATGLMACWARTWSLEDSGLSEVGARPRPGKPGRGHPSCGLLLDGDARAADDRVRSLRAAGHAVGIGVVCGTPPAVVDGH